MPLITGSWPAQTSTVQYIQIIVVIIVVIIKSSSHQAESHGNQCKTQNEKSDLAKAGASVSHFIIDDFFCLLEGSSRRDCSHMSSYWV